MKQKGNGKKRMKISIISFTEGGVALSEKVEQCLRGRYDCTLYTKYSAYGKSKKLKSGAKPTYVPGKLTDWAEEQFAGKHALLFIGACGIAVRSIAPSVRDKLFDSPVLVMEETGQYVIPLLSGHYGGANALARQIAKETGAIPVITTATDVNRLFAVDVFAAENNLWIAEHEGIARVSVGLLERRTATMAIAGDYEGKIPEEILLFPYPLEQDTDVLVAVQRPEKYTAKLQLVPRSVVLGMGCKKGKTKEEIEWFVLEELERLRIPIQAVAELSTIDRKKEEAGLLAFAEKYGLALRIYTAEELSKAEGEFSGSSFVEKQVGTDNVCERAAVLSAGENGTLWLKKTARDGMTLAVSERQWSVRFDET